MEGKMAQKTDGTTKYFFSSMTRISYLHEANFSVKMLPKKEWQRGDYVVGEVLEPLGPLSRIELHTGRLIDVSEGDLIIGVFGKRYATLEVVGSWEHIGEDGEMEALSAGGIFGKCTSKAHMLPSLLSLLYRGHVILRDSKVKMQDFVKRVPEHPFHTPVVLLVGSSMSAGKTTAARILVRQLKMAGLRVIGAKLAGTGRYRDILKMQDAGADHIFDFVNVGLPTTLCSPGEYRKAIRQLLSRMSAVHADVAVIEIGASPLEPYNGSIAVEEIKDNIVYTVLCAFDPYAVVGIRAAYGLNIDLVSGIATNTEAGVELVKKLTGLPAMNLLDKDSPIEVLQILMKKLNT